MGNICFYFFFFLFFVFCFCFFFFFFFFFLTRFADKQAVVAALLTDKRKPCEVDVSMSWAQATRNLSGKGPGDLDSGVPSLDDGMERLAEVERVK